MRESIFEAAMRMHDSLNSADVMSAAVRMFRDLPEFGSWAIYLKSDQFDRLELVRAVNPAASPIRMIAPLDDPGSLLVQSFRDGRMMTAEAGDGAESENRTLVVLPLVARGRTLGVVQTYRPAGGEIKLAEMLCNCLAQALGNAIEYDAATRQTLIDDLTRLYNVRYLYQTLDNEIRRARRYGAALSVVFLDMDGFKRVNDLHGHCAGSITLVEVAQVIRMSVRETDFVARYGGDEFVVMMPETTSESAAHLAERLRERIETHTFSGGRDARIRLTASFGIASYPRHGGSAERLIELADAAMYAAKQREKNSVRLAAS